MVVQGSGSPVPTIAFGEGRRPEAATHVTLPAFDGPLALLLALIEARQLDVLTVPLGSLAGAYLEALAALEDDRMGNVSTFVAIASQLILIKSRAMLPRRVAEGAVALAALHQIREVDPGIRDSGDLCRGGLRCLVVIGHQARDHCCDPARFREVHGTHGCV